MLKYLLLFLVALSAHAGTLTLNTCTNGDTVTQLYVSGSGNVTLTCAGAPVDPPPIDPPVDPPSPCTGPINGSTGNAPGSYWTVNVPTGGSIAYKLPITPTVAGKYVKPSVIWTTGTPDYLRVDMAIAECQHQFTVPNTKCFQNGPVSGTNIRGDSVSSTYYCPMTGGKQYFINVRTTNCPTTSCSFYLQYNGTF